VSEEAGKKEDEEGERERDAVCVGVGLAVGEQWQRLRLLRRDSSLHETKESHHQAPPTRRQGDKGNPEPRTTIAKAIHVGLEVPGRSGSLLDWNCTASLIQSHSKK
jgi:hypothetical protein